MVGCGEGGRDAKPPSPTYKTDTTGQPRSLGHSLGQMLAIRYATHYVFVWVQFDPKHTLTSISTGCKFFS